MRRLILVVMLIATLASPAFATPITTLSILPNSGTFVGTWVDVNDCSGAFGQGFDNCRLPENGSPIIAKWDTGSNTWTTNSLFPSVTGAEWTIANGFWSYTPGPGDPLITAWVQKLGNDFQLYRLDGLAPVNVEFTEAKLSHLSFYDTAQPVPEPGSMSLLGIGLIFCGRLIRKGWAVQK